MSVTTCIQAFGNKLLVRPETWGLLISDVTHDRVWGVDHHWKEVFNRLVEWSLINNNENSGLSFSEEMRQLSSFSSFSNREGAIDPWLNKGSFFWGTLPKEANFRLSGPIGVGWFLTNKCNSNCLYCCSNADRITAHKLTLGQAKQIVDNLANSGILRLNIGGGEPSLFHGWRQLLEHCNSRGIYPVFSTNGRAINATSISTLSNCCGQLQISFDTTDPELHHHIRGDNDWKRILDGIVLAVSSGIRVRIVTVLSRLNEGEITKLASFFWGLGVRQWIIFWIMPSGRANPIYTELAPENNQKIYDAIQDISQRYPQMSVYLWGTANMDRFALNIADSGDLVFHDYQSNRRTIAGNLLSEEFAEIWERLDFPVYDYLLNWVSGNRVNSSSRQIQTLPPHIQTD